MRSARLRESDLYETDPYPELRQVLAPEIAELPPGDLATVLAGLLGSESAAEDLESFWSGVKKFGRAAGGVLQKALPVVGTVAGTALGGPVGAALGGAAGNALSGALGGALAKGPRGQLGRRVLGGLAGGAARGAGGLAGALGGAGGIAGALGGVLGKVPGLGAAGRALAPALGGAGGPAGGSPAAAQLLKLLSGKQLPQALLQMALGNAGKRQVPVAGMPVPAAAFTNLLGVLANRASAEHHLAVAGEAAGTPLYLLDGAGEFLGDPADPVSRAEALLLRLAEAEALEAAESDEWDESDERAAWAARERAEQAAWEDELDALELLLVAEEED